MSDIGAMLARAIVFYTLVAVIVAFGIGALVCWGLMRLLS